MTSMDERRPLSMQEARQLHESYEAAGFESLDAAVRAMVPDIARTMRPTILPPFLVQRERELRELLAAVQSELDAIERQRAQIARPHPTTWRELDADLAQELARTLRRIAREHAGDEESPGDGAGRPATSEEQPIDAIFPPSVACATCGAEPGKHCVTSTGNVCWHTMHKPRRVAAAIPDYSRSPHYSYYGPPFWIGHDDENRYVQEQLAAGAPQGVEPQPEVECPTCHAPAGQPCITYESKVLWTWPHSKRRRAAGLPDGELVIDVPAVDCPQCAAGPGEPCVKDTGILKHDSLHTGRAMLAGVPASHDLANWGIPLRVRCDDHGEFVRWESRPAITLRDGDNFGRCPVCASRTTFVAWERTEHARIAATFA